MNYLYTILLTTLVNTEPAGSQFNSQNDGLNRISGAIIFRLCSMKLHEGEDLHRCVTF